MVQIYIEGLKPEIRNQMIKKSRVSRVSLAKTFDKAEELEKHREQKLWQQQKKNPELHA
jgi:hypothetical protein